MKNSLHYKELLAEWIIVADRDGFTGVAEALRKEYKDATGEDYKPMPPEIEKKGSCI